MTDTYNPYLGAADDSSPENSVAFLIRQALGRVNTMVPVKVVKVYGGGVAPPGTVDVMPLVNQTDGVGTKLEHGTIFSIPWSRSQGADNVVINDPVVGDVGTLVVSHRDISSLKANKGEQSNPGSRRRFDLADGVYHGSGAMLNQATPTNYVNMNGNMIIGVSPKKISFTVGGSSIVMDSSSITITSATVKINGSPVDING